MRICKKIAILTLIICITMTLNVFADNSSSSKAEITLTTSKETVKVSEEIKVVVSASCDDGIEAINAVLKYDREKLELVKSEMKNDFTDQSGTDAETGEYILTALYGATGAPTEAPSKVDFAELTFKVLEKAEAEEKLEIELLDVEIINPDLETISGENKKVTLTVIEEEPEQPKPQEPEQPKPQDPKPSENKKPVDNTTADKNINYAGIEEYAIALIAGVVIVSIILYKKYKKYSDIY